MIHPLNEHYSFTNPASIHDEESLTALELAGRTTSKINEVVDAQNKLDTETNDHLKELDKTINERFTHQDETINERFTHQDEKLQEFKESTIPTEVKKEMQNQINDGTFDNAIDVYVGDLKGRVDNLFESVTEGSTILDAEIIDTRIDFEGNKHNTMGDAVRSVTEKLDDKITTNHGKIEILEERHNLIGVPDAVSHNESCTFESSKWYLIDNDGDGAFTTTESGNCCTFSVSSGEKFLITTSTGKSMVMGVGFNTSGEVVKVFNKTPLKDVSYTDELIVIPEGVTSVVVNCYTSKGTPSVKRVIGEKMNYQVFENAMNDNSKFRQDHLENVINYDFTPVTGEASSGEFFNSNGTKTSHGGVHSVSVPAKAGEIFRVTTTCGGGVPAYSIMDGVGLYVCGGVTPSIVGEITETFIIPSTVRFTGTLHVHCYQEYKITVEKVDTYSLKSKAIKNSLKASSIFREEFLGNLIDYEWYLDSPIGWNTGCYIDKYGETKALNNASWKQFTVTPYAVYKTNTAYGSNTPCCIFFNADGNVISVIGERDAIDVTENIIIVPENAVTMVINNVNYGAQSVHYLIGAKLKTTKPWSHLKWVVIGDSLTERNDTSTKFYHDYIKEITGIEVINLGYSGMGYKQDVNGKRFYDVIDEIPEDADVITIFGSCNDLSFVGDSLGSRGDTGFETVYGSILDTYKKLTNNFPGKQIGVFSPTPWASYKATDDPMSRYAVALSSCASICSIPYYALHNSTNFRPWYTAFKNKFVPDGIHPNAMGHKIISSHIYHALLMLLATF